MNNFKVALFLFSFFNIPLFAEQFTNLKVKSILSTGEKLVIVRFSTTSATTSSLSGTIPSEVWASMAVATNAGFNNIPFTLGDVKSYTALILTAYSNGNLVDIDVGYTLWGGGYLFHSAKVK